MKRKLCTGCGNKKSTIQFDKYLSSGKSLRSQCRTCCNMRLRKLRKKNPKLFRGYDLKKHYGISLFDWEILFRKQKKQCAICKRTKPNMKKQWFTDHGHKTKKVRGILCGHCNSLLGYAHDEVRILVAAIKYLQTKR